jgi:hypothetical protein
MDDIIGSALLFGLLFGLEIVAVFVLIMSTVYGRQLVFVILCGIVAAVLMAIESLIWWICVAGNYEFGFRSETALIIVSAVSVLSLGIYFPLAIIRCKRKQAREAHKAAPAISPQ